MSFYSYFDSPIGRILLVSDGVSLTGLYTNAERFDVAGEAVWEERDDAPPFPQVREQLADYFAGKRTSFDLPLALEGTPFQRRVWAELQRIPFGETISYQELARRIGNPKATQAVGAANGRNPISIIVPCHRVIGADGSLVGYGGGLERKAQLLAHEGALLTA